MLSQLATWQLFVIMTLQTVAVSWQAPALLQTFRSQRVFAPQGASGVGANVQPAAGLHAVLVHELPSSHGFIVPTQPPPAQVSLRVQLLLSSQGKVFGVF